MTHQFRRDLVPSSVSWNSPNIQRNVVGNLAILESVFLLPFENMLEASSFAPDVTMITCV